jgi:hypothetical protein
MSTSSPELTVGLRARISEALDSRLQAKADVTHGGNKSEYVREILEIVEGLKQSEPPTGSHVRRAADYMEAKLASLNFEADVGEVLRRAFKDRSVSTQVKLQSGADPYVADFVVEYEGARVIVECKSSPRRERLELALGQAILAKHRTGLPVVTVVPYFIPGHEGATKLFEAALLPLVTVEDLVIAVREAAKQPKLENPN